MQTATDGRSAATTARTNPTTSTLTTTAAPSSRPTPPGRPQWIAHRGASSTTPENTLAAVRAGVAAGCDAVEVDVRRTADRALVVHHDASLARTTNVQEVYPARAPWRVSDFTLAELARLEAGSWFGEAYAGESVPTLEQVLDTLRGTGAGLLLELKDPRTQPGVVAELASELRCLAARPSVPALPEVLVQSFDHRAMALLKAYESELSVGLLGKPRRARLRDLATWATAVNPHHWSVDAGYVEAVRATGMRCLVWTPDSERTVRRALGLGVDGVITDHVPWTSRTGWSSTGRTGGTGSAGLDENGLMTTSP